MIEIRNEGPGDQAAIQHLNEAAFEDESEAAIVDKLRASCGDYVSFVAVDQGIVVGHILFTPITIDRSDSVGMGLAPMAVLPSHQQKGIGSLLVRHGIEHLNQTGCPFIVVLGHPEYHPRFGFEPASRYKLRCQWEGVPDETFMSLVFDETALPKAGAVARYREEFNDAM